MFDVCNTFAAAPWFDRVVVALAAFGLVSLILLAAKLSFRLARFAHYCYRASRFAVMGRLTHISRNVYGSENGLLLVKQLSVLLMHAALAALAAAAAYIAWYLPAAQEDLRLVQIAFAVMTTFFFVALTLAPPVHAVLRAASGFVLAQYRLLDASIASVEGGLRSMEAEIRVLIDAAQAEAVEARKRASIRVVKIGPVEKNQLARPGAAILDGDFVVVSGPRRRMRRRRA